MAAHAHSRTPLGAQDARDYRHVVADHVVEKERLPGLVNQCCDMADVDRLFDIDEFAFLPQALEEFAEVFVHLFSFWSRAAPAGEAPACLFGTVFFVCADDRILSSSRDRDECGGYPDRELTAMQPASEDAPCFEAGFQQCIAGISL